MRRRVAVALVVISATACSGGTDEVSTRPPRPGRRTTTTVADRPATPTTSQAEPSTTQPTASAEVAAPTTTTVRACVSPYEPGAAAAREASWAETDHLSHWPLLGRPRPIDSDGDGEPDGVVPPPDDRLDEFTIERGDGNVEIFITEEDGPTFFAYPQSLGDLDGDGRDDIRLEPYDQATVYLVPGSTPPGRHDVTDVAVRLDRPPGQAFEAAVPRAGGDDALVFRYLDPDVVGGPSERVILPGGPLLEPGPGGRLERLPEPLRTFPDGADGRLVALLAVRPDRPVPLVAVTRGNRVELELQDDPVRSFAFQSYADEATARKVARSVEGTLVAKGGRRLLLGFISHYTGNPSRYVAWDVDRPCDRVRLPGGT